MAKTQIKNYVFKPGIGATGSLYPNATSLLEQNRGFLLAESIEYINQEIIDATKCQRDMGYIIDGLIADLKCQSTYYSYFIGLAEFNSLDISNTVVRTIQRVQTDAKARAATHYTGTELTNLNAEIDFYCNEVIDIAQNGRTAADLPTYSTVGVATDRANSAVQILQNFYFLAAEVNAWVDVTYPSHNHDVAKCSRDVIYALSAVTFDILYTGNTASYDSAKFFNNYSSTGATGITSAHKAQTVAAYRYLQTIIDDIIIANPITKSAGNLLSQNISNPPGTPALGIEASSLIDIVADVVENGLGALPTKVAYSGVDPFADLTSDLVTNKASIVSAITWDPAYTYNEAKCQRDLGYVLDAYENDLRYGGNEKLRFVIQYYWEQDVAQVDGNRIPEIDTHAFIGDLINNYILTNTLWEKSGNVSQVLDSSLVAESNRYTPTDAVYTPGTGVMVLTINAHGLKVGGAVSIATNALTFTCGLDSYATTHSYPRASGAPNATGQDPYYNSLIYITATTSNTITVNVGISSNTSTHRFVSSTTNSVSVGAVQKIASLVQGTVDVITNGLSSLPEAVETGVGYVKIQGKYSSDELLLITNTTKNEIIYNFSGNATGGIVDIKDHGVDTDFATYLQTTDGVTTITLNYDTSSHSVTDDLQIFVEDKYVRTRPHDFGTDAIERMRVANPQSMLDADFEYGLQPTKWSAIGTLRGYPSVYEIPGTDTDVISVVTDASAGTEGVGQSLITVTTVSPHGYTPGTPITIKALANSVLGAARAEGSFIIVTTPTATTFTFYAKAKVGTTAGQVLSTTYTQLRQAGFYTGASIGNPTFTVASNGSSGSLFTQLAVLSGSSFIPYDGLSPEIGSPIGDVTGAVSLGSQVTAIIDTSAGGGTYVTPTLIADISTGTNIATVEDPLGIVTGLSVDRGDGFAIEVVGVAGQNVEFSSNFVQQRYANKRSYTNISGINDSSLGIDAAFNISIAGSAYVLDSISNTGNGYQVGDRIIIAGNDLNGLSPENDLLIVVDEVFSDGAVFAVTLTGTAFGGNATVLGAGAVYDGGVGTLAGFDVTWENNTYLSASISSPDSSSGYVVNDVIKIAGSIVDPFGSDGLNDLYLTVSGVGLGGAVTSVTPSGTAPDFIQDYPGVAFTTDNAGTGAEIDVTADSGSYVVNVTLGGVDFLPGDTITVLGSAVGGIDVTNNITITVDNVDGFGAIITISVSGLAFNGSNASFLVGNNVVGAAATFDVTLSGGVYSVVLNDPGSLYGAGQELTISGDQLYGSSPTNDLTITIDSVDAINTGTITAVSSAGTAYAGGGTFTDLAGVNEQNAGANATFDLTREFTTYNNITLNAPGTGYQIGNRLDIPGPAIGGGSPINDINIFITNIDIDGGITGFNTTYEQADPGTNFDLISTIALSESTTTTLAKDLELTYSALASLEIDFANAHGLVPGDSFITTVNSDNGVNNHLLAAGSFIATSIPSVNSLVFQARAAGAIDISEFDISGAVYARPDSFFVHRPFDGGVQLGTGGPQHGAQAIRQSKKYIRYQSGKGIMYTTGALFAPSYDLRSVTSDGIEVGSTITVVTDDNDHGVQAGGVIRLLGLETPGYNSGKERGTPPDFDYTVIDVVDERTFKVRAQRRLGSTNAALGFAAQMSVVAWHGATVRSGIFDDQNGIFWEYDGTNISANQRTGTKQIAGNISLTVDNNLVTGTDTRFRDQVKAGDRIVIKGMTHVVSHVISDTQMTITPDWRGVVDITGTKINLVVDKKVKQEDFNLDRLDGTGPSGYDIDIAKMQMIGIQYSWYGAGFIDFMLRGSSGDFVFCHRMRNSNVNTEAFMRSGNLPVRYEVTNEGPPGQLAENITSVQTTIPLVDGSFFPQGGTIYIDNEIIQFTGRSGNTLTGCTRSADFTNFQAGSERTYTAGAATTHDAKTGVILISQTITPLISHWGSAFLTDGGFDEDRGYIFSYAATGVAVTTTKNTALMIRLAPSVSNAIVGDLGERELLNRAQLLLQGLEITSDAGDGGLVVQGVLNPQNYPVDPGSVSWSGLGGVAQGGQPSFAQIAPGGAIQWSAGGSEVTVSAVVSGDITTSTYTPLVNGTSENSSPIEILTSVYNGVGPAYTGVDIYSVNPSNAYTGGSQGTYRITGIRTNGNQTLIDFRSTTGRTTRATNWTGTPGVFFRQPAYTGFTNRLLFSKAVWDATGAAPGTAVSTTDTKFPAGTAVSSVIPRTLGANEFYEVIFNQTSILSISSGQSVVFGFIEPAYAQPGETVFSFIAVPGERSTLDLSQLKELTNTALGGRGTFPNGPDVLAINVYKISGAAINANIILRWGEAQA